MQTVAGPINHNQNFKDQPAPVGSPFARPQAVLSRSERRQQPARRRDRRNGSRPTRRREWCKWGATNVHYNPLPRNFGSLVVPIRLHKPEVSASDRHPLKKRPLSSLARRACFRLSKGPRLVNRRLPLVGDGKRVPASALAAAASGTRNLATR